MKISIITVCYNSVSSIEETILSVINQTYKDLEYIVIDGGSSDGTIDIIKKYSSKITYWISEPDKGVYDAMNKGLRKTTSEWVCFMNSGDTFHNNDVISNIFSSNVFESNIGVIYGDTYLYKNKQFLKQFTNKPFWETHTPYRTGKGICHQSMFTRTLLARNLLFDLQYKVSADFNMAHQIYKLKYKFKYIPIIVCNFDTTGISSNPKNWRIAYKETGQILNCRYNIGYWLLFILKSIKSYLKS